MLYYCQAYDGNFGDFLNPWLWSRMAPEVCDEQDSTLFVGIGTILTHRIPRDPFKVVFGAGCWEDQPLPRVDDRWKICCVRGPLTADRLRLDPALAVVDPAILVRRLIERAPERKYPVSFMPHARSMIHADWNALCARIGFHCIDPRSGVEPVLRELQDTRLLVTEAMHGAIVADALRVPWIPVRLYRLFSEFKWRDWTQSIRVPFNLTDIPPIFARAPKGWKRVDYTVKKRLSQAGLGREDWKRLGTGSSTAKEIERSLAALKQAAEEQKPCLSDDTLLSELEARLLEKLAGLRQGWIKRPAAPA